MDLFGSKNVEFNDSVDQYAVRERPLFHWIKESIWSCESGDSNKIVS